MNLLETLLSRTQSFQFSSVAQSCPTLCDPVNRSTPGLPVHHQLLEFTQTHVHWVDDAIQPSHPLSSPSPPILNVSQHQVFSNESALRIRWPKYWSFSFNISPSNEHLGLISFRMEWLYLLVVQGTLKSLLQHHSWKASILWRSAFFIVQLSHPYMTTGKTIALTRWTFVDKVMSLLFNMLCRLVITFLPRSKRLLISWLKSPSAVILEPQKIKSATVSTSFWQTIYLINSLKSATHRLSLRNSWLQPMWIHTSKGVPRTCQGQPAAHPCWCWLPHPGGLFTLPFADLTPPSRSSLESAFLMKLPIYIWAFLRILTLKHLSDDSQRTCSVTSVTCWTLQPCALPGSSVRGILQARVLEWVAMPSSRASSQPRDQTCITYICCIGRQILHPLNHLGSPWYPEFTFNHLLLFAIFDIVFFYWYVVIICGLMCFFLCTSFVTQT